MFAYCNNNPVNYCDSSGASPITYCNGDRNPLFIGYYGCGGGGGGGSSQYEDIFEELDAIKDKTLDVICSVAEYCWDAYVHSNELQVQQKYQQDMAVRSFITGELDSWSDDPKRAGDFAANLGSATVWSIEYVAFAAGASIPVIGQGVLLGVGAVCLAWSTLRYYNVI